MANKSHMEGQVRGHTHVPFVLSMTLKLRPKQNRICVTLTALTHIHPNSGQGNISDSCRLVTTGEHPPHREEVQLFIIIIVMMWPPYVKKYIYCNVVQLDMFKFLFIYLSLFFA